MTKATGQKIYLGIWSGPDQLSGQARYKLVHHIVYLVWPDMARPGQKYYLVCLDMVWPGQIINSYINFGQMITGKPPHWSINFGSWLVQPRCLTHTVSWLVEQKWLMTGQTLNPTDLQIKIWQKDVITGKPLIAQLILAPDWWSQGVESNGLYTSNLQLVSFCKPKSTQQLLCSLVGVTKSAFLGTS